MNEKKQARIVKRGFDINTLVPYEIWDVGPYEIWDVGDGRGIYVDFYDSDNKTLPYESGSKAFPVDMNRLMVDGEMIGSWPYDAIGGKAIRELGYEPIEEES